MRREMADLRKEVNDTELAVQRLESQVTILSLGKGRVDEAPITEVAGREKAAGRPERSGASRASQRSGGAPRAEGDLGRVLPVVRLSGRAEPAAEDESWVDPGALDDGSPPIQITLGEAEARDRLVVDDEVLKRPDPVLTKTGGPSKPALEASDATSREIEGEYGAALAKLRIERAPREALSLFQSFAARYPKSNLADNAAYWIGECRYAMGAYREAASEFERLSREHPRSGKVPEALLRAAESWVAAGEPSKAKPLIDQVIESFPKSEAAGRARARLGELDLGGGK